MDEPKGRPDVGGKDGTMLGALRTAFGPRVEDLLTLVAVPVALGLASSVGVRFSVMGVLHPLVTQVYERGFALLWVVSPLALLWCKLARRFDDPRTDPLTLRNVGRLVRGLVSFSAVLVVYSNLKTIKPLVVPWIVDDGLEAADRVFTGFTGLPNEAILGLDAGWFVWLMDWSYMIFFPMFAFTMTLCFFRASARATRRLFSSLAVIMYLGILVYYLVPSLGTLFVHPQWYQHLLDTRTFEVGAMLISDQLALVDDPGQFVIGPFGGIAAFPSLHVAQSTVFLAVSWRFMRPALILLAPVYGLLIVSTVYFGMHYVWDIPAGVLLALASLRIERWVGGPLEDSPYDW